jgi:hypothetical protein
MGKNQRLGDAIHQAGLTVDQVAGTVGVGPKTVRRWLDGSIAVPRADQRNSLVELLAVPPSLLWPELPGAMDGTTELVGAYVSRSQVSPATIGSLLSATCHHFDLLAFAALWLWDSVPGFASKLAAKMSEGVQVRVCLGDPASAAVRLRGGEEGIGEGLVARCQLAVSYARPLARINPEAFRLSGATLYASVVRFDDDVLWNTHLWGNAASESPVLHVRRRGDDGLFANVVRSFEKVWGAAQPFDLG